MDEDGRRRYLQQLVQRASELAKDHRSTWQIWTALGQAQLDLGDHQGAAATLHAARTACAPAAPITYLALAIAYAARNWRGVTQALHTLSDQPLGDLTAQQQETLTLLRRGADETG
ncbi:hypothetical protein [Lacticaseibacillus camelliae]|uniref:hypothetical protein n=1 Tax=Lacticaseibacillus camelliae TaxID=381742 RepID=UPI0007055F83|nr:hypothetical protein [Lacticaseibacillus camelliae]